jgi:hypothetical protein
MKVVVVTEQGKILNFDVDSSEVVSYVVQTRDEERRKKRRSNSHFHFPTMKFHFTDYEYLVEKSLFHLCLMIGNSYRWRI